MDDAVTCSNRENSLKCRQILEKFGGKRSNVNRSVEQNALLDLLHQHAKVRRDASIPPLQGGK